MYTYSKVATENEVKIFNKVNSLLTDDLVEKINNIDPFDMLDNKIPRDIKKQIKALGLTVNDINVWYFID